ncbi:MAG TPA: hypothetical protein DEB46_14925 [Myxococcales bacterium]|nr:hypothetical protein [Myxococcales bacterium]
MTSFKGPRRAVLQLPELALQWVFIQEPRWREKELVLSRSDHPGARVLALNEAARRRRIRVHQTLAQARALAPELITYPWPEAQLILCQERVAQWLSERVPSLALFTDEPGVFVLDVSGLEAVVGPLKSWAQALLVSLQEEEGLWGRIVLGYDPMPARVLCPQACPVLILRDPEMEQAQLAEQPLSALGLNARLQGQLAPLGLRSIGDFLALGAQALGRRFGAEAEGLHRCLTAQARPQLKLWSPVESPSVSRDLEPAVTRQDQLLFAVKRELYGLLSPLAERGRAVAHLRLNLDLDSSFVADSEQHQQWMIRPAEASLDETLFLDLLRLSFVRDPLRAPAVSLSLEVEPAPAQAEQLTLFRATRRDINKAREAITRLRTELGAEAVCQAKASPGHLPEAQQGFAPLEALKLPEVPPLTENPPLVRRLLEPPEPMDPPPQRGRAWLPLGPAQGAVKALVGPYLASGGWWAKEQRRRYFFARLERGELLWIFQDVREGNWFLQGWVQ